MAYKLSLNHFMRESAKKIKKPQKCNLVRNMKHMAIVFDSNHFNKILYTKQGCVPFYRGKQTKFEQFYVRKCQKRLKNLKKHNLACNIKLMTIIFDSNHFNTIIYTK